MITRVHQIYIKLFKLVVHTCDEKQMQSCGMISRGILQDA